MRDLSQKELQVIVDTNIGSSDLTDYVNLVLTRDYYSRKVIAYCMLGIDAQMWGTKHWRTKTHNFDIEKDNFNIYPGDFSSLILWMESRLIFIIQLHGRMFRGSFSTFTCLSLEKNPSLTPKGKHILHLNRGTTTI